MGGSEAAAMPTAGPVALEERLLRLETQDIARRVQRSGEGVLRWLSDARARAENAVIAHTLTRTIRRVIAEANDYETAGRLFDRFRMATHTGRYGFFNPMSSAPTGEGGAWSSTAEIAHWEDIEDEGEPDAEPPVPVDPTLFYVPGCGFILPPSPAQVALAFRLGEACGCETVIARHRLAPEYPFPAAIHDLADRYAALLASGQRPERIIVAGDSAGATLVLSMLLELRARKLPMPAGGMLFSPWADLAMRGWSYISKSLSNDSPFRMETAAFSARLYLGEALPTDPRASPLYASLAGFPPMVIHCSRYDMHFDDAVGLAERAREAEVAVQMNYWDSPRHHLERFRSRDADHSLALAGEFAQGLIAQAR